MFKKLPIQRVVSSDREILNPINMTELKRKMTNLCLSIFFFFFFLIFFRFTDDSDFLCQPQFPSSLLSVQKLKAVNPWTQSVS